MSVATTDAQSRRVHPSRALVVAVRATGVSIPAYRDLAEIQLDLPGLSAIEQLAAGLTPEPGEPWDSLISALVQRGLLADPGQEPTARPEPAVEAPASDVGATSGDLVLPTPALVACGPHGFEFVDHDGAVRARLHAVELVAASAFRSPVDVDAASRAHLEQLGSDALAPADFQALVERLVRSGVLLAFDTRNPDSARRTRQAEAMRDAWERMGRVLETHDDRERDYDRAGPSGRVPVWGMHSSWSSLPASLGMVMAAAKGHQDGLLEQHYAFRPRLAWDKSRVQTAARGAGGLFLFSNYTWSSEPNLATSALIKQLNPNHVTIHGGPDTPKYEGDVEAYFAAHPHVDITVHGEGEATLVALLEALRDHVGDGVADLSPLADVAGLSFRLGDRVIRTGARDRIADLDELPSPMLTGLFDGFIPAGKGPGAFNLETNRGCPYGCTFCDWGSATLSRVRKFDLERVFGELEWCAIHGFRIAIADANFGIFERDVEIAERIAQLKATYGYPRSVGNNYAKNTVKHLSRIIEIFTEAGIVAEGKMSMQSFDTDTLLTIRRKNIKLEQYHDLSVEFRLNQLPMSVDLMMGLPGSSPTSFRNDLQSCIDRDLRSTVHATVLLPNSPMNDPAYRQEHRITAIPGEEVRESASFTRDEWGQMDRLRSGFWIFENFNVLRQVASYVRRETGRREVDFYDQLVEEVAADPERWPIMSITLRVLPTMMVPPVSWRRFVDEAGRYLIEVEGLVDDSALATVLAVQHALLPSRDRTFPVTIPLDHDYEAWHAAITAERDLGHYDDWHERVGHLRDLEPALFTIDDPYDSCQRSLGPPFTFLAEDSAWDLDSPVSRPRQGTVGPEEAEPPP
jgi:hypothetical protein